MEEDDRWRDFPVDSDHVTNQLKDSNYIFNETIKNNKIIDLKKTNFTEFEELYSNDNNHFVQRDR